MSFYQPADEPATERLLMIVLEGSAYGGDHRHLRATVVRRAERKHTDPDTMQVVYGDGEDAEGYRNCEWSSAKDKALYVQDFSARCQMTIRNYDGKPVGPEDHRAYGSDYCFRDVYQLERREAKRIAETFRRVDAAMEKLNQELGYANDDFAALCIRLAKVLGIKTFVTPRKNTLSSSLAAKSNYIEFGATSVASHVRDMVDSCYPKQEA